MIKLQVKHTRQRIKYLHRDNSKMILNFSESYFSVLKFGE